MEGLILGPFHDVVQDAIERLFGDVLRPNALPVEAGTPCQVNLSFGLPYEVQHILQELLILDHPKLLQLEERL